MKQMKKIPQPNYVRKLHDLWHIGALPRDVGVHLIDIHHDAWCAMWQGKRCNGDPEITLKATVPGVMN